MRFISKLFSNMRSGNQDYTSVKFSFHQQNIQAQGNFVPHLSGTQWQALLPVLSGMPTPPDFDQRYLDGEFTNPYLQQVIEQANNLQQPNFPFCL